MNRIVWGFIKTFWVTYFFVFGTEVAWTTWHHVWFSLALAGVGSAVGLLQTTYDYWRRPAIALGNEPTDEGDDIDDQAL